MEGEGYHDVHDYIVLTFLLLLPSLPGRWSQRQAYR